MNRSPHSVEFRKSAAEQVVALREAGQPRPVATVARRLGINRDTLSTWVTTFTPTPPDTDNPQHPPGQQDPASQQDSASQPNPEVRADPAGRVSRASGIRRELPLIGLARHARCGALLWPGTDRDGLSGYVCRVCPGGPVLPAEPVHRHAVAAVARQAPHLARTLTPHQLPRLLVGLGVDHRCRTIAVTWRSATPTAAGGPG